MINRPSDEEHNPHDMESGRHGEEEPGAVEFVVEVTPAWRVGHGHYGVDYVEDAGFDGDGLGESGCAT